MHGCDAVVHLAAQISVPASIANPQENNSINVEGTQLILDYCNQFDVKRVVVASSAAVYGHEDRLPLTRRICRRFTLAVRTIQMGERTANYRIKTRWPECSGVAIFQCLWRRTKT